MRRSAILLLLAAIGSYGQQTKSATKGSGNLGAVADAMVASLKAGTGLPSEIMHFEGGSMMLLATAANRGKMMTDNPKRADEIFKAEQQILNTAANVTGDSFAGTQFLDLDLTLWLYLRDRGTEELDAYVARAKKVAKQLLLDWQQALVKVGVPETKLTVILFGIMGGSLFWDGADWKAGNPQQAITRLNSLPRESLTRWAEAGGFKDLAFAANTLASVNGLFVNGTFQTGTFDGALPIAQQRIPKK